MASIDLEAYEAHREAGLIRRSVSPSGDLYVWTYTPVASYSRTWDEITRACRGLVTTTDGTIVSRCLPKFWNLGEPEAPTLDELAKMSTWVAYDKMDGSMILVSNYGDGVAVSTKGSFTTWHSETAREMLGGWRPLPGTTAMFEFIHPKNRIVLDYDGFAGLVLLGALGVEDGYDYDVNDYAGMAGWFGEVVPARKFNLRSMVETMKDPEAGENREGFVIVYREGYGWGRVKMKFARYMALHGTLTNLSNVKIWEAMRDDTLDDLLPLIPEDVRPSVDRIVDELNTAARDLLEATMRVVREAIHLPTRKDQAALILSSGFDNPALAFLILDDRDPMPKIWDAVRPDLSEAWRYLN